MSSTLLANDYNETTFALSWDITYNCNYKCNYCKSYITGWNENSLEKSKLVFDKLNKLLINYEKVDIWFSGGEPSILPWITTFCKYIKATSSTNTTLGITSNGSQPLKTYLELFQYIDTANFSLHFAFAKYTHFLKKFIKLGKIYPINITIMAEPGHINVAKNTELLLKKYKIPTTVHIIRKEGYSNTASEVNFVLNEFTHDRNDIKINNSFDSAHRLVALNHLEKFNFKNWYCYAGINNLFINHKFEVYTTASCGIEKLGNILTDDIKLKTTPTLCDGRKCTCVTDIKIRKTTLENISTI